MSQHPGVSVGYHFFLYVDISCYIRGGRSGQKDSITDSILQNVYMSYVSLQFIGIFDHKLSLLHLDLGVLVDLAKPQESERREVIST